MKISGWDYPPGCSSTPYDEDYPCEVCGEEAGNCICPECPVCGGTGDPECYLKHGMQRTEEQRFNFECKERWWKIENLIIDRSYDYYCNRRNY